MSETHDILHDETRRSFLRTFAVIGGAAAGGTIIGTAGGEPLAKPDARPTDPEPSKSKGYRATAHVKTYYEKARL